MPLQPHGGRLLTGKYEKGKAPLEGARFSLAKWGYVYNQKYWEELNFSAVEHLRESPPPTEKGWLNSPWPGC